MFRSSIPAIQSTVIGCKIPVDKHIKRRVARTIINQLSAPVVSYNATPAQLRRNHHVSGPHHSTSSSSPLPLTKMANLPSEPEFQQAYNGMLLFAFPTSDVGPWLRCRGVSDGTV
jgi:hypothetical protein